MKNVLVLALIAWCMASVLKAQTVTTITTNASSIDDDIILDHLGNLYGSNYDGSSIFKRASDGTESIFTGGLSSPNGLAFDSDSNLIAVDNTGNRIYRVHADGSKDTLVNFLPGPSGIIREKNGNGFIVTSYTTHKLWKLSDDGTLTDYLEHPEFNGPVGLCYDDDQNLYVANFNDRKIFKVSPDDSISFFARPIQGTRIGFIAYANGFIYSTAMNAHRIYKIDLDGNAVVWLGSSLGNIDGDASQAKFNLPNGIRASFTGDTLYVSDYGSKKVRMITNLGGSSPAQAILAEQIHVTAFPNPSSGLFRLEYTLEQSKPLNIILYDSKGSVLEIIHSEQNPTPGLHQLQLDLQSKPSGQYTIQLNQGAGRSQPVILVKT